MERFMKKWIGVMFIALFAGCIFSGSRCVKAQAASVEYRAHVQSEGWNGYVRDGATAGTVGKSRAIEALKIRLRNASGGISYQSHLKNIGWSAWVANDATSGTTGQSRPVEAIRMNLTGAIANTYDVYYRVHVGEYGWLGWTKNGGIAGSVGCSMRVEAIQIRLCAKGRGIAISQSYITRPSITVQSHVGGVGWQGAVGEGAVSGTTGQSKRIEAMVIRCSDFTGRNGIQYRSYVQNTGWQGWCNSGGVSGTTGRSLQIEAVQIRLAGNIASAFQVYYRVHVDSIGWLGWAKNGATAGTTGGSKRIEAIQIKLVRKGDSFAAGGAAYRDLSMSFQMPLSNARCTWRSYSNWSWGNKSGQGSRVYHLGVDIIGSSDTVMATAAGTVARCGYNSANGNYVILKHNLSGKTVYSFYAHLASYSVRNGAAVAKGSKIGTVGNTGSSSRGKHLHFAMMNALWNNGAYYGYSTWFSGNKVSYGGVTYYNPVYIIQNNRLP